MSAEHGLAVANLPPHHRDPFDRLLVAQARQEGFTLVTADSRIHAHDVAVLDPLTWPEPLPQGAPAGEVVLPRVDLYRRSGAVARAGATGTSQRFEVVETDKAIHIAPRRRTSSDST